MQVNPLITWQRPLLSRPKISGITEKLKKPKTHHFDRRKLNLPAKPEKNHPWRGLYDKEKLLPKIKVYANI
jgi:hypothetical protein